MLGFTVIIYPSGKEISDGNSENLLFYRSSYFLFYFKFLCEDTKLRKQFQIKLRELHILWDFFSMWSVPQMVG